MSRDFYRNIEVKVPNRSGEDLSYQHTFTGQVGTLIPSAWHEVIPGTKVYLKNAVSASLPPLASDTYMKCRLKSEVFFVPFRQLSCCYSPWLTGEKLTDPASGLESDAQIPLAKITLANPRVSQDVYTGSLADYLGFKMKDPTAPNTAYIKNVNIFPFLCYHWIWDNMYRNSRVQRRAFSQPSGSVPSTTPNFAGFIPFIRTGRTVEIGMHQNDETLCDGKYLCQLRQRNFDSDYFTNMTNNPQSVSNPAAVTFQVDGSGNGSFTIAALRAQNSLQIYLERQNLAGFRLTEFVKANYGVNLHEGIAQMPVFLGRQSLDVYSKGVDTTAETASITNNNPFAGTVGARYGSAYALGNDTLIDEFEAKEPGIIMVLTSFVPKVTYASGIDPLLKHYLSQSSQARSVANPLLQNVGQQAVLVDEISSQPSSSPAVFGYTDRYAEFMTKVDRVSGLFKDGESLQSFVLQRSFSSPPVLSSSFLEIPTTYLDQVTAVSSSVSTFGYQVDMYFEFKIVHPLHQYSIPSLQDPAYEHGKGVIINRSAQIVN